MRIEIPVFPGVDEMDVFGPFEPLAGAGIETVLVGVSEPGRLTSQRGVQLIVEDVLGQPDVVVVPGGGWLNRAAAGTHAEYERGLLPRRLAEVAADGALVTSVCTGAFLLQKAGLLDGRSATTNHVARAELRALGVDVLDERVVDAGPVITAAAPSAGVDLGVWIVERLLGTATADRVCGSLDYVRQGRVWRSPSDHTG